MHQLATAHYRWFVLLLAISLGACQRASYSFQPVAAHHDASVASTPVLASAVVATTPIATLASRQPVPSRRAATQHFSRHPMVMRFPLRALQAEKLTTVRLAAPTAAQQVPPFEPGRRRSRGVAFLLAFFLGGIGAHLFYLGYHARGTLYALLAIAGIILVSIALIGFVAAILGSGSLGFVTLAAVGAVLLGTVGLLAFVDTILILTNSLKPKNGDYYPGFFQTHDRLPPTEPTK